MSDEKEEEGGGCGCFSIIAIVVVAFSLWIWTLPSEEERVEEQKAKVDALFEQAQALPSSAVCENYNAYKDLQSLEERDGSSYYTDISSKKIVSYGTKCLQGQVGKPDYYSNDLDRVVMGARNQYLASFESVHLSCTNPKITYSTVTGSEGLWILTGDRYDKKRHRRNFKLKNTDVEMLIRLAKKADASEQQIYEVFTINKSGNRYLDPLRSGSNLDFLQGYSTGKVSAKVDSYSVGRYDLDRETFTASFYDRQTILDDGRRPMGGTIGEFEVEMIHTAEMTCQIISVADTLKHVETRSSELRDAWLSEIEAKQIRAEKEKKMREQEQKAKNKI
ncbi:hypothetical protein OAP17_03430 [Porticoccaceae bacterium]|nr:hypothetical protein [Porticoccaceae bacterium]